MYNIKIICSVNMLCKVKSILYNRITSAIASKRPRLALKYLAFFCSFYGMVLCVKKGRCLGTHAAYFYKTVTACFQKQHCLRHLKVGLKKLSPRVLQLCSQHTEVSDLHTSLTLNDSIIMESHLMQLLI